VAGYVAAHPGYVEDLASDETIRVVVLRGARGGFVAGGHFPSSRTSGRNMADEGSTQTWRGAAGRGLPRTKAAHGQSTRLRGRRSAWAQLYLRLARTTVRSDSRPRLGWAITTRMEKP